MREGSRGGRASERRKLWQRQEFLEPRELVHVLSLAGWRSTLCQAVLLRFGQGSRPLLGLGATTCWMRGPPPPLSPRPTQPQEGGEEQRLAKLHANCMLQGCQGCEGE